MGNVPLDAVTVEVVRAALNAAAERMRITLIKTAYNHIISESLDFGCAIFDPDVQMIAQGIGLPVFQGHLGFPIQATLADRGLEAFREGDVFMHNDPYAGNGNHLNDVAMYAPVFWEGALTGFVSVKAHWSDVGGPVPSSMQIGSREFRQEGLRFQSVRLFDRGECNEEVMRMIRGNIRTESGTLKDVQAMIAVCRTGEASFHGPYEHCVVKFLEQAGVHPTWLNLVAMGIHGNGHMMMLEKNSDDIAAVMRDWLLKAVPAKD